jgi:hypothetical protein
MTDSGLGLALATLNRCASGARGRSDGRTMTRRREQIALELQKLAAELRRATPTVVWNVRSARRLGEMLDPRDRASVEDWGTVG